MKSAINKVFGRIQIGKKERRFLKLLKKAKKIVMTPEEKEEQRRGFAHYNAALDNPLVTRELIDKAAENIEKERMKKEAKKRG